MAEKSLYHNCEPPFQAPTETMKKQRVGWGEVEEYLNKIRLLAGLLTNNHYKNAHELEDPA